ncbi:hypothetical protein GCM10008018_60420 [Paenibacillus marchantiophytorum]|uniref:HTH cro/C1-type domain-containing protein n=1 Tax=Paenibacillus marchantiophytorum TaxID=1619310 RepID=A0ABQ1FE05_9BACL|nr:helix-turn-helix domain-containing protein [Paenibacillus marchantiophytorum]GGA06468.1 hypothetical protein GCM10008018_60420 [Paenibacillus marchantiophytorum]
MITMNSDTLRKFRAVYNLNQTELAQLVGVSFQLIVSIETGRRPVTHRMQALMVHNLGLTSDKLAWLDEEYARITKLKESLRK